MKNLVAVFVLATGLVGQTAANRDFQVTAVAGESWLSHLHRTLEETHMGKTGRLGPAVPTRGEDISGWQPARSADPATQNVTLKGSDLYRLNCQGCHGEAGLGAPQGINSVINPTRASSVALTMERMKKLGMNLSRAEALELANQSRTALLERVHHGGADMPPFPHLSEPEVDAIVAYLNRLADVPGADEKQAAVEEPPFRVGEHIVKSTCHICHNAAGANPTPEQLWNGAIPPLDTLTTRTSLPQFIRKVTRGAPVTMGTPPMPWRGRMPAFYYLSENEAADVYLYLTLYPPYAGAVLDPGMPAPPLERAAGEGMPFVLGLEPTKPFTPGGGTDTKNYALPLVVELFAILLLGAGLLFTRREFRRLSAKAPGVNVLVIDRQVVAVKKSAASDDLPAVVSNGGQKELGDSRFPDNDYRAFESTWLTRQLENRDWVA
jgi:mono/diheme cytochrome c family protein